MSYKQASKQATILLVNAANSGCWFEIPERLIHLRSIMTSNHTIEGTGSKDSNPIVTQLQEAASELLYDEKLKNLLLRAANKIIADEVKASYKQRWSSYTIDGTGWAEAAFEPMSNQELFRWAREEGGPIVDCQY